MIKYFLRIKFWQFLWNYLLATMEMVSHDYNKAIYHLTKCLKIGENFDPSGLIYEQLGKCYFDVNDIAKGKFYLLKVLEIRENIDKVNSEITSRIGFIFFQEERYDRAKYYLEHAKAHYGKRDYTNINAVKDYLTKLDNV